MIGLRLKNIRESINLTQKEFGDKINIAMSAVSRYELNDTLPNKDVLNKIVEFFNINLHWLLTGNGTMLLTDQPEGECPNCAELQKVVDKLEGNLELLKSIIKEACAHNHLAEKKITG